MSLNSQTVALQPCRKLVVDRIASLPAMEWDRLAGANPTLSHAFLAALEETGCVGANTGWRPRHIALVEGGALVGAVPLYLKSHSNGEFVFDWSWAEAAERGGRPYYPKLVSCIPFTPVPGPRLLAESEYRRGALLDHIRDLRRDLDASGAHILFCADAEAEHGASQGYAVRRGVQLHWQNPGWKNFDAFLSDLTRDKRKKIRQERRRVFETGVRFRQLEGRDVGEADWAFFFRCYANTYAQRGQTPYLSLPFFLRLAETMPAALLLVIAERDGRPIASALNLKDDTTLYGRWWGELEHVPFVHFEACYYQGIDYAILHGMREFQGGAQGEHKLARGFLPVPTFSLHAMADEEFQQAIDRFLDREGRLVDDYAGALAQHGPFRE